MYDFTGPYCRTFVNFTVIFMYTHSKLLVTVELGDVCQSSVDCSEYPRTKCTNPGPGDKFCQCNNNAGYYQILTFCLCDPFEQESSSPCDND